jgi:hypothetical protein
MSLNNTSPFGGKYASNVTNNGIKRQDFHFLKDTTLLDRVIMSINFLLDSAVVKTITIQKIGTQFFLVGASSQHIAFSSRGTIEKFTMSAYDFEGKKEVEFYAALTPAIGGIQYTSPFFTRNTISEFYFLGANNFEVIFN